MAGPNQSGAAPEHAEAPKITRQGNTVVGGIGSRGCGYYPFKSQGDKMSVTTDWLSMMTTEGHEALPASVRTCS